MIRSGLILLYYYIRTLAISRWTDRKKLERWQEKKIMRLLNYVSRKSPYYKKLIDRICPGQWRELPVIDKRVMMEHFSELNTAGIDRQEAFEVAMEAERSRDFSPTLKGITVGLSSGTSGHRGLFLVSRKEQAAWAGTVLAKVLPEPLWRPQRVAFFLRSNSNLYSSVRHGRMKFRFFDLLEPVASHIQELNHYSPTLLVGPPSLLRMLAEAAMRGSLTIRPKKIVSVAEVLDPLDEKIISQGFAKPVHQVYQCTEGFLAATCEHGTLHLNEDIVYFEKEYLDREKGKFVPILTDFSRFSQPLIRYRLNDILTEKKEPCPCGSVFTALEQIEGRCDDLFYLRAESPAESDGLIVVFPDYIRRVVLACPGIEHYAVIQHQVELWEIQLALENTGDSAEEDRSDSPPRSAVESQIRAEIAQLCQQLGGLMPTLQFTEWSLENEQATLSAPPVKRKRVERRFPL
ncbi:F390 synthetase-related protein [Paenibacillus senegalensis]|uniref:F390 synthetase-related protein n=1 Tax=Paenibacillus senegalensis TaxID=1465766 RepID=UPI000288E2C3|nr:F390 synthetase-related protein [Paenibacillus senegalensis]